MDHNLQKYITFVKTVELGSFTKAAAVLNYTQSSVSKMIADLEREWQVALLQRDRNGVTLTAAGERLLPYARLLLEDYRKIEGCVDELHGLQTGKIRIGTFASVAIHWLPNIVAHFQKDYPGIEYEMLLGDYEEVARWIDEGRVDCGFLRLPTKPEFDTISIKKDEYVVVLPKGHPLAKKKKIPIETLEGEPFMLLEHGGRTEVSELLEQYQVNPQIRFTTWEDYAILAMVEKGFGIGILPRLILQRIPYEVEIRPLQEPYFREIGVAMKNRERVTPVTERFFSYLHFKDDANMSK